VNEQLLLFDNSIYINWKKYFENSYTMEDISNAIMMFLRHLRYE